MMRFALLALTAHTPAWAQDTAPKSAQATDASEEAEEGLQDIVVTAEKREASVKDVPASITVLGGEQLSKVGATQISDYAGYVPGLTTVGSAPGQTNLVIRGLTTGSTSTATVGVYVDDTAYGTARGQGRFALDLMPYDVERIEVLRGPQGTLYGAATLGGLFKYVTRRPDLNELEVRVGAEVRVIEHGGGGHALRGAINVPIVSNKLAVRVSGYTQKNPGYIDSVQHGKDVNGDKQEGFRASLLARPVDNLSIRLAAAIQTIKSGDNGVINVGPATPSRRASDRQPIYGDYYHSAVIPAQFDQKVQVYSANIDWDFGWASIISDTSLAKSRSISDIDNSVLYRPILQPRIPFPLATFMNTVQTSEKWTQELRLASPSGGSFEWLIGGYYTDEKNTNDQLLTMVRADGSAAPAPFGNIGYLATVDAPTSYREMAVFGDATYRFSDRFDITAGLRYSENTQRSRQISSGLLFGPTTINGGGQSKEDVLTYAVSPRFHLSPDVMIYARVASGYRPGGPNVVFPGQTVPATYKADTVVNYEAGIKGFWLNRKLSIDASVFHIDWKDIQIVQVFGGVQGLGNGDTARSQGFEIATVYQPVRNLNLGVNLSYTDAKLTADAPSITGKNGDRVPFVAKLNASATIDYSAHAFRDFQWSLGAGYRFRSGTTGSFQSAADYALYDASGQLDAHIGLGNDMLDFQIFARNMTDTRKYVGAALPGQLVINQPRVFGMGVNASF